MANEERLSWLFEDSSREIIAEGTIIQEIG